jgi:metal-sulfur cluster biosynthetic enzyme
MSMQIAATDIAAPPIGPHTTVRDAVRRYPGIDSVFERHGIGGCGGADGPIEPIAFFARVHDVEPAVLLRELNDYAARRDRSASVEIMEGRPRQATQPYFIAVIASLTIAIVAGFPLGILAALGAGRDIGLGTRWTPLVQAHGHLQLVGFAGLFIIGITYHALPRFKNSELALPRLALPSIALVASGAILRTLTQPWSNTEAVSALMVLSAVLELAGAVAFVAVVIATLRRAQRQVYDRYLLVAAAGFVAASVAHLFVLTETARDGASVIAASRNAPLLEMYFFGFITLFVLGISIRVLPHFLSLRPPRVGLLTPALLVYTAGLLLRISSGWLDAYSGWSHPEWLVAVSVYAMAVGILLFCYALNLHLPAARDETSDSPGAHEKLIRTAYLWLAIAFAIEAWYATKGLTGDFQTDFLEAGAARHALALGFFTQMIFGVGSRALPAFAGKKLYSATLVTAAWVLINLATVQRVGHALFAWGDAQFRFDHIAAAGVIGLVALLVYTYNIMRTVRPPRRRRSPSPREETNMAIHTAGAGQRYVVSPESIVADVIREVPGSLETLIAYGFKPLADPELRARVASTVTLKMACSMHGVDINALIADLTASQQGTAVPIAEQSPRQRILNALRDCYDPEIRVNIVDLGLVYEVEAKDGRASIGLTLTSPDCPLADKVLSDVRERVRKIGFTEVDVRLVREPAWAPSRMTPAARQALGWQ